jgi:hypothetical protein
MTTSKRIHPIGYIANQLISYYSKVYIQFNIICIQLLCLQSDSFFVCDICGSPTSVGVSHDEDRVKGKIHPITGHESSEEE